MKMADAYGVSEEKFIEKMEWFLREDLGSWTQNVSEDPLFSLAQKEWLNSGQMEKVKSFIQFVKTQD